MNAQVLHDTLSTIAEQGVPATTDLWPALQRRLAPGARGVLPRLGFGSRRLQLAAVAMAVVGIVLVRSLVPGQLSTTQAAELARQDPQVAAILRGDIAIVTVASVVNDVATVVVKDSHGQAVTVTVDMRSRIVTRVYEGPELSAALTSAAMDVIRTDPRTSALLRRGAIVGRIVPLMVTAETTDPATGRPKQVNETWAQAPLTLGSEEWLAYVNLPGATLDQLVDPHGTQVPLP